MKAMPYRRGALVVWAAGLAVVVAASVLVLMGPLAEPAHTQAAGPPTLTGEVLFAQYAHSSPNHEDTQIGEVTVTSNNCSPESEGEGTISYTASGPATGPYPGTYTETGTITVRNGGEGPFKEITSFNAEFEIVDEFTGTRVSGTKSLDVESSPLAAGCDSTLTGEVLGASTDDLIYEATIETPSGTFTDRGTSDVFLAGEKHFTPEGQLSGEAAIFDERFYSDLAEPEALLPSTKEQCKEGGYERFGFENQGQCIKAVNDAA
jgi:hypothetical protein